MQATAGSLLEFLDSFPNVVLKVPLLATGKFNLASVIVAIEGGLKFAMGATWDAAVQKYADFLGSFMREKNAEIFDLEINMEIISFEALC